MAGKKKPFGISNVISIGASVVIVGLLFKINHYPNASLFIAIGLGVEALLFLILGLQRDYEEIDWTRAYPELAHDYTGEPVKKVQAVQATGFQNTAALDKMLEDAKIGPELIQSLGTGLRSFGDKVNAISRVTDAGEATITFTNKIKEATASYTGLSNAFEKASASLSDMANTGVDSKTYHEQVNNLAKNMSALNAMYELELQDSGNHLKSMNKFYENMGVTMQNFNESVQDSQQFKTEVNRLAKNLASLNAVYGNMLSAMSQPRV